MEVKVIKWLGRALLPCAVMVALAGCEQNKKEEQPPVGEKITPMEPATPGHSPAREQPSPGAQYPHSFKPKAQPNVSPSASGTRMEI